MTQLSEYRIEYCRGCMACMRTGRCVIPDDAMDLRDRLYACDGIILASPSYGIQPTARMKNFMTDRIGMYTVYTSSLAGKYFLGISTAGGIGAKKVAKTLAQSHVAGFFGRAYSSGHLGVHRGTRRIEEVPGAVRQARALGRRLAHDIARRTPYRVQGLADRLLSRVVVRRRIARNIRDHKDEMMKAVYQNLVARGYLEA